MATKQWWTVYADMLLNGEWLRMGLTTFDSPELPSDEDALDIVLDMPLMSRQPSLICVTIQNHSHAGRHYDYIHHSFTI